MGLSPGTHTEKYALKCHKRREYFQKRSTTSKARLKRMNRKKERALAQYANEALEGDTYESGKLTYTSLLLP